MLSTGLAIKRITDTGKLADKYFQLIFYLSHYLDHGLLQLLFNHLKITKTFLFFQFSMIKHSQSMCSIKFFSNLQFFFFHVFFTADQSMIRVIPTVMLPRAATAKHLVCLETLATTASLSASAKATADWTLWIVQLIYASTTTLWSATGRTRYYLSATSSFIQFQNFELQILKNVSICRRTRTATPFTRTNTTAHPTARAMRSRRIITRSLRITRNQATKSPRTLHLLIRHRPTKSPRIRHQRTQHRPTTPTHQRTTDITSTSTTIQPHRATDPATKTTTRLLDTEVAIIQKSTENVISLLFDGKNLLQLPKQFQFTL
jgi:hypothetical protein